MADPEDDDFLSRWSRRKRGEFPEQVAPPEPSGDEPSGDEPSVEGAPPEDEGDPEVIAQLPDIAGMDDSSDFSVFLKTGVPEALRRRALRKLWRVNPVLANLDGLNDYDEDYTQMSALGEGMKTLYRVGKGFATEEPDVPVEDVVEEPETLPPPESPPPTEPEPQTSPIEMALDHADAQPAESAPKHKGAARNRRWGGPAKPE